MSGLALASVRATPGPVSRAVLADQLASIRLPRRTVELLGEAGLGPQASGLRQDAETEETGLGPRTSGLREQAETDNGTVACGKGLRRLVEMLAGGATDAHAYREAVARLVGLGPGLTPTGDDLLIALLAASMRLSAGDLMSDTVADKLNHEVGRIPPGRTTVVAHRLLSEAATGRFPQPLADLVRALGDRTVSRDELDGAVRWLAATGAHSGCDWLAGVVALAASVVESRGEE